MAEPQHPSVQAGRSEGEDSDRQREEVLCLRDTSKTTWPPNPDLHDFEKTCRRDGGGPYGLWVNEPPLIWGMSAMEHDG